MRETTAPLQGSPRIFLARFSPPGWNIALRTPEEAAIRDPNYRFCRGDLFFFKQESILFFPSGPNRGDSVSSIF